MADPQTQSGGGFIANTKEFFKEHRIVAVATVIGAAVGVVILYLSIRQQSGTAASTAPGQSSADQQAANRQGSLAAAGYQDAQTATALTQITSQLDNLTSGLQNWFGTTPAPASLPPTPPPTTPPPSGDAVAAFLKRFGASPEILRIGSNWYYVSEPSKKKTPLSSFFPAGTTFQGSGTGAAYAVLPGGQKQVITTHGYGTTTPVNKQASHSPTLSYLPLTSDAVPGTDLSHPGIGGWLTPNEFHIMPPGMVPPIVPPISPRGIPHNDGSGNVVYRGIPMIAHSGPGPRMPSTQARPLFHLPPGWYTAEQVAAMRAEAMQDLRAGDKFTIRIIGRGKAQ